MVIFGNKTKEIKKKQTKISKIAHLSKFFFVFCANFSIILYIPKGHYLSHSSTNSLNII